jgi:hypothetical protein
MTMDRKRSRSGFVISSATGLGMVTSNYRSENTEFVALFNFEHNRSLKIHYLVTRCATLSKDLFNIGAAMIKGSEEK